MSTIQSSPVLCTVPYLSVTPPSSGASITASQDCTKAYEQLETKTKNTRIPSLQLFPLSCEETIPRDTLSTGVITRFNDIICPLTTAVRIGSIFLHANYVQDKPTEKTFIAGQLPPQEAPFWKFILENECDILDLNNGISSYPPTPDLPIKKYDSLTVKVVDQSASSSDTTQIYEVADTTSQKVHRATRCHFKTWFDHAGTNLSSLKYLVEKLENASQQLFIHCRAGVGRTGTLITAYFLKHRILKDHISSEKLPSLLEDLILNLRQQRGPHFVTTFEQYSLLYDYGTELLTTV